MSVQALVSGRLIADPDVRTGESGKSFTLAKVAAATEDGDTLVSCIAFGTDGEQLGALGKGDAVSVSGCASVRTWAGRDGEPRGGLSVTVDAILTAYTVRRRRAAVRTEGDGVDDRADEQERADARPTERASRART
jgi:single-stranded DNA-binding protein